LTYTATAVISAMPIVTQVNQYDQPVAKPARGPMNSSA
jgi:hypothetical protein